MFPKEAPKLSSNFLSLSIFAQAAQVFLPPDHLVGILSYLLVVNRLTAHLAELLWDISCSSVTCDDRSKNVLEGLLHSCKRFTSNYYL